MTCFDDTKGVIRNHRTDNTMVKRKRTNSDLRSITQKTNNRVVTRSPLKTMASSSPVFSSVCVAQALVFCVCVAEALVFCVCVAQALVFCVCVAQALVFCVCVAQALVFCVVLLKL